MKITLYIDGREVQLNEQNLILLNYQFEDFSNPTDIKNSYSQSITLDGTDENDSIFGQMFRTDRRQTAEGFNPLLRKPFVIFNEMGEKLEEGYVKLDSIEREGCHHNYKVTLYGKLGSVFYSLAYNEDGTRKTLADLDYLKGGEDELDFYITAKNVEDAWYRISITMGNVGQVFDVINFAPCYNGIPDKKFDANKGIIRASTMGLPDNVEGYTTIGGKTLITFADKVSEQQVGDMRAWLQRPVVSTKSILSAVRTELAKQGIEFDYDDVQTSPYFRTWMTLPLLPNSKVSGGGGVVNFKFIGADRFTSSNPLTEKQADSQIPADAKISGKMKFKLYMRTDRFRGYDLTTKDTGNRHSITFVQGVIYSKDNIVVGNSNICYAGNTGGVAIPDLVRALGYAPKASADYLQTGTDDTGWTNDLNNDYFFKEGMELTFGESRVGGEKMILYANSYLFQVSGGVAYPIQNAVAPFAFGEYGGAVDGKSVSIANEGNSFSYKGGSGSFSASRITKRMLLSTEFSPADYIISFAKAFGFVFVFDKEGGMLNLMKRSTFFGNAELVDLSGRVDESTMEIVPNGIDSKFYLYGFKEGKGKFEEYYKDNYGQGYGIKRVNTGFDFNGDSKKVMEKVVFPNGVCAIEESADFADYRTADGKVYPAPVVKGGAKYTLWKNGESKEFPINVPVVTANWFNGAFNGYDYPQGYKLQCHDKTGKEIGGTNVLLFYAGEILQPYSRLTDDDSTMIELNKGIACWNLEPSAEPLSVPVFTRAYRWDEIGNASLDYGVPQELPVPPSDGLTYPSENTIYERCWKRFVEDRLNVDSKVVKVKVNFNGMKVEEQMLRRFYWFDGCVWSLNRVINHSLTTDDLTECEFVRVQNIENYKQA